MQESIVVLTAKITSRYSCQSIILFLENRHEQKLIRETRVPIPAKPNRPEQFDYEYERNGTAVNFMFCEFLNSWRKVNIRERRTDVDWALEIEELLEFDQTMSQQTNTRY